MLIDAPEPGPNAKFWIGRTAQRRRERGLDDVRLIGGVAGPATSKPRQPHGLRQHTRDIDRRLRHSARMELAGQGSFELRQLEVFVLDEADRMLDIGFIHDVKRIIGLLLSRRQTLLFSATMPREAQELADA